MFIRLCAAGSDTFGLSVSMIAISSAMFIRLCVHALILQLKCISEGNKLLLYSSGCVLLALILSA